MVKVMEANEKTLKAKLDEEQKSNEILNADVVRLTSVNANLQSIEKELQTKLDDEKVTSKALKEKNDELKKDIKTASKIVSKMESNQEELKTKIEDLTNDLKVATNVMVNLQSSELESKVQLQEEMVKNKVLEDDKATLGKNLKAAMKLIKKMQSEEKELHTKLNEKQMTLSDEISQSHTEANEELKKELDEAKAEIAEMQLIEDDLKQQLGKVFIRVNSLLDQIEEKDETITVLQETNQRLTIARTRSSSRGRERDTAVRNTDALTIRKTPSKNMQPSPRRSSLSKPPPSPMLRSRVSALQEELVRSIVNSFDECDVEVDQENSRHPLE
jgi:chromosome segregation ATPase